jgi:hypothetical protein
MWFVRIQRIGREGNWTDAELKIRQNGIDVLLVITSILHLFLFPPMPAERKREVGADLEKIMNVGIAFE